MIDGAIEFSENGDEVVIGVASSDGSRLKYQDILDVAMELISSHFELVTVPAGVVPDTDKLH